MERRCIKKARAEAGAGIFSGENYLIPKLGEAVGGLIHLGRSTGDETTGTLRMTIRKEILEILQKAIDYRETLRERSPSSTSKPPSRPTPVSRPPRSHPLPITFWTFSTRQAMPAKN